MEAYRQEIILSSVGIYLILCIAVGIWAMRRTSSADDFFVAGKGLGPIVVSLAVFSSTLSGFGFVGGPGLFYGTGVTSLWMVVASGIGYGTGFFLVAKRIRMIAEVRGSMSLPDIFYARYGSNLVRGLSAVTILLGVLGYMAVQILTMALVLQSILAQTPGLEDISVFTCVVASSAVLIFYCVTGGIIASVYTDLVQGFIMMIAGVLVFLAAQNVFDNGFSQASAILMVNDAESILPFGTLGPMAALAWFFLFGLGLAGQPHMVTKMMMNKRLSDNRMIVPITVIGYVFAALLWLSIGIMMRALVLGDVIPPLAEADQAAPVFLSNYAHPLLAGIVFAGLFAAIMSTADAFLNIGAAAIIHDLPKAIRGRSLDAELLWARIATVVLSVIAAGIGLYSHYVSGSFVGLLGAFGWATFASGLAPVLLFGLNWKRATPRAAVVAISISLIVNFGIKLLGVQLPYAMDPGFIAFLASLILFITLSLMEKPKRLPRDIDRILEL